MLKWIAREQKSKHQMGVAGQDLRALKSLCQSKLTFDCRRPSEMPTLVHRSADQGGTECLLFIGVFCSLKPPPFTEETNDKRLLPVCW